MQIKTKVGLAFAGVGLLLLGAYAAWHDTRRWVPVSIPIQISPGSIVRQDFSVNVDTPYTIEIEAQKKIDFDTLNCLLGMNSMVNVADKNCQSAEVVGAQWILLQRKKVIASGSSSGDHGGAWANDTISREIGRFDGKPNQTYHLEVKFLNDGRALSETNPHLVVGVDADVYEGDAFRSALIFVGCAVLVLIGCLLLVASAVVSLRRSRPGTSGPQA